MEEENQKSAKKPLVLDWEKLLPAGAPDEDQPLPLVVPSTTSLESPKPSPFSTDQQSGSGDSGEIHLMSDHELEEKIRRQECNLKALVLVDKGEKLMAHLKRLLEERERRKLSRLQKCVDECKKPTQSEHSVIIGVSDGSRQESRSPQDHPQSSFGKEFSKRIDENSNSEEFYNFDPHDRRKRRSNGYVSPNVRQKCRSSPRKRPVQFNSSTSRDGNRHVFSSGDLNSKGSTYLLRRHRENLNNFATKRNAFQVSPSKDLRARKGQTVVIVDEEDYQAIEAKEHEDELTECMKDAKIYYPSRDDPDPVIICYADVDCLAPEAFLTSTIMNFYIRYLQQQATATNTVLCDYLFFNTYFYEKLKEAIASKGTNTNTKFLKFRRWWKGVNIFQKAYVLIPIHQDLHWSLVIICIPDKEDESGPIILHLDSLGLHSSRSVFDNIKSCMKEEWACLNEEAAPMDLPIAENIWKNLPRRIEEKKIMVPQQKNDYDCGLFVLFYMERFIVDAPSRLVKKKDLPSMFGRQWFKPEEASSLRRKIRNLLKKEFQNANRSSQIKNSSDVPECANVERVTDILE